VAEFATMAIPLQTHSTTMVFESFLTNTRMQSEQSSRRDNTQVVGFASDSGVDDVYNEEAFRHFLTVERMRAERSERSFLLLLVSFRKSPDHGVRVPRTVCSSLFSGLALCVREVDFIGWYRDRVVAGAVLAQGLDEPDTAAPARIIERVTSVLTERLPSRIAERLRVRVVHLGRAT
jgi:hypothetical protein